MNDNIETIELGEPIIIRAILEDGFINGWVVISDKSHDIITEIIPKDDLINWKNYIKHV